MQEKLKNNENFKPNPESSEDKTPPSSLPSIIKQCLKNKKCHTQPKKKNKKPTSIQSTSIFARDKCKLLNDEEEKIEIPFLDEIQKRANEKIKKRRSEEIYKIKDSENDNENDNENNNENNNENGDNNEDSSKDNENANNSKSYKSNER